MAFGFRYSQSTFQERDVVGCSVAETGIQLLKLEKGSSSV